MKKKKEETTNIKEKELLTLVRDAVKLRIIKNDADEALSVINDEILDRLTAMKITGTRIDGHFVSKVKRLIFSDVPLSKAKEYGATKTVIDADKMKKIYLSGVKIKGVKVSMSIRITEAKDK